MRACSSVETFAPIQDAHSRSALVMTMLLRGSQHLRCRRSTIVCRAARAAGRAACEAARPGRDRSCCRRASTFARSGHSAMRDAPLPSGSRSSIASALSSGVDTERCRQFRDRIVDRARARDPFRDLVALADCLARSARGKSGRRRRVIAVGKRAAERRCRAARRLPASRRGVSCLQHLRWVASSSTSKPAPTSASNGN